MANCYLKPSYGKEYSDMLRFLKNNPNFNIEKQKSNQLHGKKKLQYIWDYYKLPIFIICILLYIISYTLYGHFTDKRIVLSTALVNITSEETLISKLSDDFLTAQNIDTNKNEVRLYTGLYLTDNENNQNYQYAYATQIKILGIINTKKLDVILMNKEAFDIFSQRGYLYNLEELLKKTDDKLYKTLSPFLEKNTVILEDDDSDLSYQSSAVSSKTEEYPMGLNLSKSPVIQKANLSDSIYLGIIANAPNLENSIAYIRYFWNETLSSSSTSQLDIHCKLARILYIV